MKVFVFVLMVAVAMGGMLGGYRLITGRSLIGLTDFGIGGAHASVEVLPTATLAASAAPSPTALVASTPVPEATATPSPANSRLMVVGNTDGQGVFLRKTPQMSDKLRAWVDGTKMQVTGEGVEADGVRWLKVKAPDGTEGYIPQQFLVPAP